MAEEGKKPAASGVTGETAKDVKAEAKAEAKEGAKEGTKEAVKETAPKDAKVPLAESRSPKKEWKGILPELRDRTRRFPRWGWEQTTRRNVFVVVLLLLVWYFWTPISNGVGNVFHYFADDVNTASPSSAQLNAVAQNGAAAQTPAVTSVTPQTVVTTITPPAATATGTAASQVVQQVVHMPKPPKYQLYVERSPAGNRMAFTSQDDRGLMELALNRAGEITEPTGHLTSRVSTLEAKAKQTSATLAAQGKSLKEVKEQQTVHRRLIDAKADKNASPVYQEMLRQSRAK